MSSRAPSATPLWDQVAELKRAAGRARERLAELEAQRTAGARRLRAAEEEVGGYWEEVGAGRERDPAVEGELLERVREAGAGVTLELSRDGRSGQPSTVLVDQRAERLVVGAQRAVQAAEADVVAFLRRERAGLAAELTVRAEAAQAAQQAALPALTAAVREDHAVRALWREWQRANGMIDTLQSSPLRGFDDELAAHGGEVPVAIPVALADRAPT